MEIFSYVLLGGVIVLILAVLDDNLRMSNGQIPNLGKWIQKLYGK